MAIEKPSNLPETAVETPAEKLDHEVDALMKLTGKLEKSHDAMGEQLYELAQNALEGVQTDTRKDLAALRQEMLNRKAA